MSSDRRNRNALSIVIPFLIIAIFFGVLIWKKYRASRQVSPVPNVQETAGAPSAVLFFVADGSRLAREAREIEPCNDDGACVKEVLEELLSGPVGDLDEAFPEGVLLNSVKIQGDTAVVDLNRNFSSGLPSGSSAEMMAVYSIVNTVCVNFPKIAMVKMDIEGDKKVILGHLDLSDPLMPDYTLEQPLPDAADEKKHHKNSVRTIQPKDTKSTKGTKKFKE